MHVGRLSSCIQARQSANFRPLCTGFLDLTSDPFPDIDDCAIDIEATRFDMLYADVGATNEQGWSNADRAVSTDAGNQIDHIFVNRFSRPPTFSRRYNPLRPFNPPAAIVAAGRQTLSDHAEIEMEGGSFTFFKYETRIPYTQPRLLTVDLHAVHAGIEDGCGAPDSARHRFAERWWKPD